MCLARVEFAGDEQPQEGEGLSDIAHIECTPDGLRIVDLMGKVTELEADIRSVDFMTSVVNVQKVMRSSSPRGASE